MLILSSLRTLIYEKWIFYTISFTPVTSSALGKKIIDQLTANWQAKKSLSINSEEQQLQEVIMMEIFFAIFQIADEDGSGCVSMEELINVASLVGKAIDPYHVRIYTHSNITLIHST